MSTEELREFRGKARRFALASACAIVGFGVVNLVGFLWNRSSIERLDDRVRECVQVCEGRAR